VWEAHRSFSIREGGCVWEFIWIAAGLCPRCAARPPASARPSSLFGKRVLKWNLTWRASSKTSKNMNVWTLFPHCPVGDIVLVCQEAGVRWVWYIIWNQCDSFIYLNLIVKNRKIIIERYFKWWWLLYKHGFCVSGGIESLVGHPTVPQQLPLKPPPHVTLLHKPPYSHREITNHRQTSW
jgi:hypothetical protein